LRRAFCIVLWIAAEPDFGGGGDELQFGVSDYELAKAAEGEVVGVRSRESKTTT